MVHGRGYALVEELLKCRVGPHEGRRLTGLLTGVAAQETLGVVGDVGTRRHVCFC